MKNLMTAAIIAISATAAHADKASAIDCVNDHFEKHAHEHVMNENGHRMLELTATLYDYGNDYLAIGLIAEAEETRQSARDNVKAIFGRYGWAGEINYCFRQHMGE